MDMDMNNPLWVSDPEEAKKLFEKELRDKLSLFKDGIFPLTNYATGMNDQIKDILGKQK